MFFQLLKVQPFKRNIRPLCMHKSTFIINFIWYSCQEEEEEEEKEENEEEKKEEEKEEEEEEVEGEG